MAKFVIEGEEFEAPESFTLGETFDAEQALGVDITETSSATRMLVGLLIAIRRRYPTRAVDEVVAALRDVEFSAVQVSKEESEDLEDSPDLPLASGNGVSPLVKSATGGA